MSPVRNQFTRNIFRRPRQPLADVEPVLKVVPHVVAAERLHRHRVAAQHADLCPPRRRWSRTTASRPGTCRAASCATRTRAARWRCRRAPNRIAPIGTPCGSLESGEIVAHCARATVKRLFGCAAFSPTSGVHGRPCQSMCPRRRGIVVPLPPYRAVGPERDVRVDRVVLDRGRWPSGWCSRLVPGTTPKKPGLGVDGPEPPVRAGTQPRDVVADGRRPSSPSSTPAAPAWPGWSCRKRWETRRRCSVLALGVLQPEDQHVLGEPALAAPDVARDPQRQALLAEERVAAVAGADRPDRSCPRGSGRCSGDRIEVRRRVKAAGEVVRVAQVLEATWPMRVMMRMFSDDVVESVISMPTREKGEPAAP